MILLGGYFDSQALNKYVANYGDEVISAKAETIKTYLKGYEITLNDIAYVLEGLWARTPDSGAVLDELSQWSRWLFENDERFSDTHIIYGCVNGAVISTPGWDHPADYDPKSRVWYTGACELSGAVYYSNPYVDVYTGEYITTLSKQVFDKNNQPFGVIALDVFISSIADYIRQMQLLDSGYGVLLDSERRIIVHPSGEAFGVPLEDMTGGAGYVEMADILMSGEDVSAFELTSIMGDKSVAFIKRLFNGWFIGITLPREVYYNDVKTMRVILSVTGAVLAMTLGAVLTFMHAAKNRSDTASQIKSCFLANMSHEIRTPMNAVLGMSELLLHEQLSERQMGYVDDIVSSTHSLLSIINDILDLSKIESGKLSVHCVNYDFQAMVDNINSMFNYIAQKKGLEFKFECTGELPKILYGDDIKLRQVLTNLCGNAVKYTEKGYVRLKVTISGDMLLFEVKDTGMGIHKEALPKLFYAYEQDKSDKKRSIVGTGLGLAISKAFVEMMNGKIMIESEEGQGTVVTVMVPLIIGSQSEVKYVKPVKEETAMRAPDANILVVDDNGFNLKVAQGLLKLVGIDAKTAPSGKAAIEMVRENDFDIVFMDHMMPEMDGVEATCMIRKLGGKYKSLPIIALTANAVQGARDMFMASGFDDFIPKPIDTKRLYEILATFLPAGKIIEVSEKQEPASPEETIESAFWDAVDGTGDINSAIGLGRVSGIESMYRDNLIMFNKKIIPDCEHMSICLDNLDIDGFAISIHAMKSTLATIGAMKLSDTAYKMESAAKDKDIIYCIERFSYFRDRLTYLHKALSAILPAQDKPAAEKEPGDMGILQEQVKIAIEAAEDYDSDAGLEAVEALLKYDFGDERNTILENAQIAFRKYDCDRASEILKEIDSQ